MYWAFSNYLLFIIFLHLALKIVLLIDFTRTIFSLGYLLNIYLGILDML